MVARKISDLMSELVETPGISKHEEEIGNLVESKIKSSVDRVFRDDFKPAPNVLAEKKGTSGKYKLVVDYHIDQIGLEILDIKENGLLDVRTMGGMGRVDGYDFDIYTPKGKVKSKAKIDFGSYPSRKSPDGKAPAGREDLDTLNLNGKPRPIGSGDYPLMAYGLFLEVPGIKSKADAETAGIQVGQQAIYSMNDNKTDGTVFTSPAMDDRVGTAIGIKCAKGLAKTPTKSTVLYAGTAQEELGLYGAAHVAKTSAKGYDVAIALDVSFADSQAKPGQGPILLLRDAYMSIDAKAKYLLEEAAKREGIKLQPQKIGGGATNAARYKSAGIAAGTLAIPTQYIHSEKETVDLRDVTAAVKVLNRAITDSEDILDSYAKENHGEGSYAKVPVAGRMVSAIKK